MRPNITIRDLAEPFDVCSEERCNDLSGLGVGTVSWRSFADQTEWVAVCDVAAVESLHSCEGVPAQRTAIL